VLAVWQQLSLVCRGAERDEWIVDVEEEQWALFRAGHR
jgi:hypothetical protein